MNEVLSPIKSNTSYNIDFILAGFNKNNFSKIKYHNIYYRETIHIYQHYQKCTFWY